MARRKLTHTFHGNSSLSVSLHPAASTALGAGKTWAGMTPAIDNTCHTAMMPRGGVLRGGAGTALVGDPQTVAARMKEYMALGIDTFIMSGYPHLEEAYRFAELVFPLLPLQAAENSVRRASIPGRLARRLPADYRYAGKPPRPDGRRQDKSPLGRRPICGEVDTMGSIDVAEAVTPADRVLLIEDGTIGLDQRALISGARVTVGCQRLRQRKAGFSGSCSVTRSPAGTDELPGMLTSVRCG